MSHKLYKYIILLFTAITVPLTVFAFPGEYPLPNLKWYSIESDHFIAHYHEGAERTALALIKIAEDVYQPITTLYDYEPDGKIHIIVKDTDDYSNGGAYYYDNKILIWATALDWDLRGTHNWLRNVFTHEFSHMIQLGASRKLPRNLPAFYLQWMNYEEEKRPDVLYGFPNVLVSYPIAMTVIPPWFAEGVAQCQAPGFGYDHWDSHRDMILRTRTLTGTLLTLDEMGAYGKNTIGSESVYNQGFSLVDYISRQYGCQALAGISHEMKRLTNYSFDRAIERTIGISGTELYIAWKDSLKRFYESATADIREHQVTGERVETEAYGNFYPVFLNEDEVIYISNQGMDYMSFTSLYKTNLKTGETELLQAGVTSRPALSSDREWIAYSRKKGLVKRRYLNDLFIYNLERNKEYRLTTGARAYSPAFSPDGKRLAFVLNRGGTKNLAAADLPDLDGDKIAEIAAWKVLTNFNGGEQIYNPLFTPDGKSVIFTYSLSGPRDIGEIDIESGEIVWLCNSPVDERNPAFSPDGSKLLYSCDETGVFNLYAYDFTSGETSLLTNVLGGAFMGSYSPEGKMIYSGYADNGFSIFTLDHPSPLNPAQARYLPDYAGTIPEQDYDDSSLPEYKSTRYKANFGKLFWLPRLAVDLNSFKPGVYVYNTDFLNWFSLFGGFAFNGLTEEPRVFQSLSRFNPQYLGDYDLFILVEYHNIFPTIFIEGYHLLRRSHQEFDDEFKIVGETPGGLPIYDSYAIDYRFSLNEADAGLRLRLNDANLFELRGIASSYAAKLRFDDGGNFAYTYFKGNSVALKWEGDFRIPEIDMDINPSSGMRLVAEIAREHNDFIDSFKVDAGMIDEVYTPYNYNRLRFMGEKYWCSPLAPGHAVNLGINAEFIDRNDVDDFFYLYAGGMPGMKGYSFYSLGGTRKFIGTLTYRFPLFSKINRRLLQAYFHDVYLGMFFDYGNAWVGDPDFSDWKKDLGISLRAKITSFFAYPTAVSLEAAYGMDEFEVSQGEFQGVYGKEWRYYLTVLFSFDLFMGGGQRRIN